MRKKPKEKWKREQKNGVRRWFIEQTRPFFWFRSCAVLSIALVFPLFSFHSSPPVACDLVLGNFLQLLFLQLHTRNISIRFLCRWTFSILPRISFGWGILFEKSDALTILLLASVVYVRSLKRKVFWTFIVILASLFPFIRLDFWQKKVWGKCTNRPEPFCSQYLTRSLQANFVYSFLKFN